MHRTQFLADRHLEQYAACSSMCQRVRPTMLLGRLSMQSGFCSQRSLQSSVNGGAIRGRDAVTLLR